MLRIPLKSDYQINTATQLVEEGIGTLLTAENTLQLADHEVYQLEKEQLEQFGFIDWFDGDMKVFMTRYNRKNIEFKFYKINERDRYRELRKAKIEGCKLFETTESEQFYILPQSMFELVEQVANHDFDTNEAHFWHIIEQAKNNESEQILFEGFRRNTTLTKTSPIQIDLQVNDDQSATVVPHILGLSDESNEDHKNDLLKSQGMKVLEEIRNDENGKHNIRYITDEETVQAYQRVNAIGKITKDNLYKFTKNPTSFILEGEESSEEIPIAFDSYRIIGMGKPYVGYFGSSILDDSPLANALLKEGNREAINEFNRKIYDFCEGKNTEEIKEIENKLLTAQNENQQYLIIGDEEDAQGSLTFMPVTYPIAINTMSKLTQPLPELPDDDTASTKAVITIKDNDETAFNINNRFKKTLADIKTDNLEKADLFHTMKPKFEPKSYQISGVNWLIDLYNNDFHGAILADDMGLGKTYQVIVFLAYLFTHVKPYQDKQQRVLIVAPTVLLDNWKNEIDKFLVNDIRENLQVHIVRGSDLASRKEVHNKAEGSFNSFDVDSFLQRKTDIVITTYETLANYQHSFADMPPTDEVDRKKWENSQKFNFGCIIYDEAHKIKNPNSQISQASRAISSKAKFSALLTGTPIENELRDLWALFDVFDPKHFGSWKSFKDTYINNGQEADIRLRNKASNYILRRLKKDYLQELPKKIENVHRIPFSDNEAETYSQYKGGLDTALERLHKLKDFSLNGNLLADSLDTTDKQYILDVSQFSKTNQLLSLLESIKESNEKVIIFAIKKNTQNILQYGINKYFGISAKIINGDNNSSKRVQNILQEFDSSIGFNVLILSTMSAGVGLTITSANHVIHYERWWNASKEDQASDRAYRIGQKKDVYIHYLISTMPVLAEKILQEKVIDTDNEEDKTVCSGTVTIDEAVHDLISFKRKTAGFLIPPQTIMTSEIVDKTITANIIERVASLHSKEFEMLVLALYKKQGYECHLTDDGKREYGADVIAKKPNESGEIETTVIQCKHTAKNHLQSDRAVIQLAFEAKEYYAPNTLIAITNAKFNTVAKEMAEKQQVQLMEHDELFDLIERLEITM